MTADLEILGRRHVGGESPEEVRSSTAEIIRDGGKLKVVRLFREICENDDASTRNTAPIDPSIVFFVEQGESSTTGSQFLLPSRLSVDRELATLLHTADQSFSAIDAALQISTEFVPGRARMKFTSFCFDWSSVDQFNNNLARHVGNAAYSRKILSASFNELVERTYELWLKNLWTKNRVSNQVTSYLRTHNDAIPSVGIVQPYREKNEGRAKEFVDAKEVVRRMAEESNDRISEALAACYSLPDTRKIEESKDLDPASMEERIQEFIASGRWKNPSV